LSQTPPALQPPNTSLQVTAEHTIKLVKNTPIPQPGPNDVLIHVKATGICGSDIHFWKKGCIGDLSVDGDCILGHEAAGIVLQVGSEVSGLVSGDRVAIEPGVPCGSCFLCSEGRYNLCEDVAFAGVYPYAGTAHASGHASGHVHPATWVHKLPDNITYEQGALLEPLSVVMHGITSCGTSLLGKAVAIHGAGPIGLIALSAARASGASPIVITDLEPKRLAFAKTLVPSCKTYLVQRDLSSKENADRIRSLFGVASSNLARGMYKNEYSAPATVLECTGVESSIVTAIYTCRRGGTVMVIGVGRETMNNFPFMHISLTEVSQIFLHSPFSLFSCLLPILFSKLMRA
jgi:L-iditol 2-dehydrogenase